MAIVRIAVSGGPGAGKTTLWRNIARRYPERVLAVPEVATLLFSHVFPQVRCDAERRAVQRAIFAVQHNLERLYENRLVEGQVLLCDRGSPDGGGYWPEGPDAFFVEMASAWQSELLRYDAVLFMESAAVGGLAIDPNNAVRHEDRAASVQLDQRLRAVWCGHPGFHHVPHQLAFADKLARGEELAERLLANMV